MPHSRRKRKNVRSTEAARLPAQEPKLPASSDFLAGSLLSVLKVFAMLLAFSISPIMGIIGTEVYSGKIDHEFNKTREDARWEVFKRTGVEIKDSDLPAEYQSVSSYCDAHQDNDDFQKSLCEPYGKSRNADLTAGIGLLLTPLAPIGVWLGVTVPPDKRRHRFRRAVGALALKMSNSIIGLSSAAFGFTLGNVASLLGTGT